MYATLRNIATAFVFLLSASALMGQVATGTYDYGTYDSHGFDTINVGNLNVHFSVPVLNKAGRGLSLNYDPAYDSSIWTPVSASGAKVWTPVENFGWSSIPGFGYLTMSTGTVSFVHVGLPCSESTGHCTDTSCTEHYYGDWVYHDANGVQHPFAAQTETYTGGTVCGTNTPTSIATATDGSGYVLSLSGYSTGSITSPNGAQIQPPVNPTSMTTALQIDANGNEISTGITGDVTDTTGKVVLTTGGAAGVDTTFTYTDSNSDPQTVTMTYKTYTVQTAFGCSGIGEFGPKSEPLVSSISYPDGSTYLFTYEATPGVPANVTGRIAGVEMPQGDTIQYSYSGGSNGIECADGSTASLTRVLNADSGSAASTWSYDRTITGTGTSQTTVTDGLANSKIYQFVEQSEEPASVTAEYYETSREVYQGAASGTPVLAQNTCYNGAAEPCTAASFALPVTQIDTYETLNGIETTGSTAKFDSYGNQTEADTYDFGGASSRGALLRKEVWTYGYTIPGVPTQDEVFDGSGNEAGNTVYAYDSPQATASSGVPQHAAEGLYRGNLTGETQYASATTSYASSATYEDTGSLLTAKTPNGTTSYSYDPTFVYQTGVTMPTPSSGVGLSTGASFDTSYTGLPLSSTDANSEKTSVASYDSMLRPLQVDYPDGGETTFTYSPTLTTQQNYQSASVYEDTETEYDGYGRVSRTETANGQSGNGYYQTDTCYDANGNVSFVSYAYQGTGFGQSKICSGAGATTSYDELGRVTKIVQANGETQTYTYLGRATESVDANQVTRITQVDGLGRPTIICEVSKNTYAGVAPTSCGTDYPGTGFVTSYAYNLATGTTTITQGAQTRVFQSDWLGRPTSITEPESGTKTFSYAYNATGLQVTETKPKANQTSASATTTIITQYDSLGRPVNVSYSDGTPAKNFYYDQTAGTDFTDLAQINLKGRLALASGAGAMTAYSYDVMGRATALDECLPSGPCGTVANNHQLHYTYDLAGDLLTATDGAGVTTTYALSPAGEMQSLTSSLSNTENPAAVLSNVQNGPDGPVSYQLGNGLTAVDSYDALGRINGGWLCTGSASVACAGGAQIYGSTNSWKGGQLTGSSDSVLAQGSTYGYDEFNRLTSRTVNSGTGPNYSWSYDRYGNRLSQAMTGGAGSGVTSTLSFNAANNEVVGYSYDAAGNMTNDGNHSYTYDADGHITAVDAGTTASYVYDALGNRVRSVVGGAATEYVFNAGGQRVSEWNGTTHAQIEGKYYWGVTPVAYYTPGGAIHFEQQDWLGTERMRTAYNGGVEGSFTSLPWGDGASATGADSDAHHYAMLDHDAETDTEHAQFRQYENAQGRWLSPDPYSGSYDTSNPQSMNRYVYAGNNPLANTDPSGLVIVSYPGGAGSGFCGPCMEEGLVESNAMALQQNSGSFGNPMNEFLSLGNDDGVTMTINGSTYTVESGTWVDSNGAYLTGLADEEIGLPSLFNGFSLAINNSGMELAMNGTPTSGMLKSPARQQCEAGAEQKLNSDLADITGGFTRDLIVGMVGSAALVPVGACVGGAAATSEGGPSLMAAGCFTGAALATNPGTLTIAALQGGSLAVTVDLGRVYWAKTQYAYRMAACSTIQ